MHVGNTAIKVRSNGDYSKLALDFHERVRNLIVKAFMKRNFVQHYLDYIGKIS